MDTLDEAIEGGRQLTELISDCTARRRVRSPSPSAMLAMARPMSVSGRISTRINMPSSSRMNATAATVATSAVVRKLVSAA